MQIWCAFEARAATINGAPGVSIRDLIKSALRMRPDRIIVGEVRGGEAMDMLQALNTGHEGSLGTAHANSCRDMLARLEIMTLMAELDLPLQAVRRQIASGVDILVHLGRMRDKSKENFWKFQKYVRMRMEKSGYNHCINGRMGVV